ncbi:MAG: deoxyribose-phosphate aldolase [Myxococcales bacterium]|nr:deoxyribose-phosphate aldolase [Myxococcales bacterium]|tara:strand:- start:1546 stop:2463 length:918 start_codon:yes stop_codon:yes gene_type:complete
MASISSSGDGLDNLVDLITQKVQARLTGESQSTDPGYDPNTPCDVSLDNCNECGFCVTRKKEAVDNLIGIGAARIGAGPGGAKPSDNLAQYIDHTLLKPETTRDDLKRVTDEARQWGFATVCVNASNIPYVARALRGTNTKPIAVVGFPLGAMTPTAKAYEAKEAIRNGAREIDMVINIGALKSKNYQLVCEDICRVVEASKPYPVKVIIEASALNRDEKIIACALSKASNAHFVKTSTGFGKGGATVEDVALMREVVGDNMLVKASGGVRDEKDLRNMIGAGADRIGASASVAILSGQKSTSSY